MNFLLDVNIVIDILSEERRKKFPESEYIYNCLKKKSASFFISSSSLDNLEFILIREIKNNINMATKEAKRLSHLAIKYLLEYIKIAKTPSYIELDYEDIEDSQIVASAKAIDAKIITRDKNLLQKYPDLTISPKEFLEQYENKDQKTVPMLKLTGQTYHIYPEIEKNIDSVVNKSNFILGDEVKQLEKRVSDYIGTKYAIGVSSGTDALVLSLRALAIKRKNKEFFDKEDLIITTPFTFTATGDAILRAGATPLFVDIDLDTYNIDPEQIKEALQRYSHRIVGIIPVHLYGQPCNMDEIMKIAEEYNLFIVEDCAQSFGAKWDNKQTGSFGDTGCFSFFPSKNLGGFGDGGMITTNDEELYELITTLRKHGGKDKYNVDHIGYNARLDTLQAAVLLAKMNYIDEFNEKRRKIVQVYNENLKNIEWLKTPTESDKAYHVFHQYTVRVLNKNRDEIQKKLKEDGTQAMVYYPVPLHKMKVFQNYGCEAYGDLKNSEIACETVLSLPMEPLYEEEVKRVVNGLTSIYEYMGK